LTQQQRNGRGCNCPWPHRHSARPQYGAATEWAEHFQKNYRLMTDEEKAEARTRLERRYSSEYGKKVTVDTTGAQPGVLMGYALNIRKCIGCRRCVHACVEENNQSRGTRPGEKIEWIQVLRMERGEFSKGQDEPRLSRRPGHPGRRQRLHPGRPGARRASTTTTPEAVPEKGRHLHADRLHAVREAALRQGLPGAHHLPRGDGPVVIDYNWCIGCKHVHERLPLLGAALQPDHAGAAQGRHEPGDALPGQPAAHARRGREVPLVPAAHPPGPLPGLRRGLPGRCPQVRQPARPGKRSEQGLARKNVFRLKAELNTFPKFFYFYD
jgi:ferredoxin